MACFQTRQTTQNHNVEPQNEIIRMLQTILTAQRIATRIEDEEEFCDRTILGPCMDVTPCNTRPVQLYTCGGTLLSIDYTLEDGTEGTSSVFRIERINGNAATFRVLAPNPDVASEFPYIKTNSFFTVDITCCCHILKCLPDTFVECL